MPNLPVCQHRGEGVENKGFRCGSNKLIHMTGYATAETCLRCPYANSPNLAQEDVEPHGPPAIQPPSKPPPPLTVKALHFAIALLKHAGDGFEKRSLDEIGELFKICETCPSKMFNGAHCTDCGCAVDAEGKFLNKLAWRSEHCPRGHW